ncbi:unnamed protein product [Blepharisma stoltei]|uniref:Uncharacterized protein n=1 Tax=Blepharisma stoltei TaxID=1481888 RepID=A0AAU9K835_9CILI|nr:unnamed protein product [Blepharisma stoltei]
MISAKTVFNSSYPMILIKAVLASFISIRKYWRRTVLKKSLLTEFLFKILDLKSKLFRFVFKCSDKKTKSFNIIKSNMCSSPLQ